MPRHPSDIYRRPELILADLLQREARGGERQRAQRRAVVLAVDPDGGLLQNPAGDGQLAAHLREGGTRTYPAIVGPTNPRWAIKARVLTDGLDRLREDADTRVFWPMFPQDYMGMPISPGEHVYVTFEGEGMEHGLWLVRVPGHDSANSYAGTESYTAPTAPQTAMDSFEENGPSYPRDDAYAGEAPSPGAMAAFED